jgi:hypothetical protein
MRAISVSLGEYVNGQLKYGIKTGFNEAFIIDCPTRDRLISQNPKSAEIIKPLVVGDDVRRYEVNFCDRYLIWTYIGVPIKKYPEVFAHLKKFQKQLEKRWDKGNHWWELRACDYYADFEKSKINYPEIAKEPRFYLDTKSFFPLKTVFSIPREDYFLLALLNSHLLFSRLAKISSVLGDAEKSGRLLQQTIYTEQLPIRRIHFTTEEGERKRHFTQLKTLHQESKDRFPEIMNAIKTLLPTDSDGQLLVFKKGAVGTEEKSDVVHDFLAFLAEEMQELNKQKQAEMKRYFGWLERNLHIVTDKKGNVGIEALTGKTAIQSYLGDYQKNEAPLPFKKLLDTLHKNKSRIGASLGDRGFQTRLEKEYEASLDKLFPIKDRLAHTDRLIDQIVYRLYGLTEQEIDIVERTR